MSIHELTEKIEEVAHHGHDPAHKSSAKSIGITMAILGVMLAFSAAMVGAQRTELVKTMVLQASKWGLYQSETTKFRVIEADLEMLKSLTPTKDEVAKMEATLREKRRPSGKADDEDTAEIKDLIAASTEDMAKLVTPDPKELLRFKKIAQEYARDVKEAKEDAEAYDSAIEVHQQGAEWYEWAQLAAEVGIVVASIALLLSSRIIWAISVCLGLVCGGTLGFTIFHVHGAEAAADQKIRAASENIQKIEADDETNEEAASPQDKEPPKSKE
jgi:hypothetical protein